MKPSPILSLPVLGRSVVSFQHFAYALFRIKEYSPANHRVGDLPRVAERLERAGRNVQILAHGIAAQVAFVFDRRHVVLPCLTQGTLGLAQQRERLAHFAAFGCQIVQRHGLLVLRLRTGFGLQRGPGGDFPFRPRFEIGRHVAFAIEILAAHVGVRNEPLIPVGL